MQDIYQRGGKTHMSTPSENQQQFSGGVGYLTSNLATFVIRHPSVTTFARVMSEANWPTVRTKIFQFFGVFVGFLFLTLYKATLHSNPLPPPSIGALYP